MNENEGKEVKLSKILNSALIEIQKLRNLTWTGIPPRLRAETWKILCGYASISKFERNRLIKQQRKSYKSLIKNYYDKMLEFQNAKNQSSLSKSFITKEKETIHQILLDLPRTSPNIPLFHNERVKKVLERVLYIWAIKHPGSGYVQGMNDLLTPLFVVFASDYFTQGIVEDIFSFDGNKINEKIFDEIEADIYFCFDNLMVNLQNNYTHQQPGIHDMSDLLEKIVKRVDLELFQFLESKDIIFLQFSFRWMNCLLLRELKLEIIVRLWDTLFSDDFYKLTTFHVYICAAILCHFSEEIKKMDFQDLMTFLQNLPTQDWGEKEIEEILAQAYILQTLFNHSPHHLKNLGN